MPGGGWPWRLGGHLGGWDESPRETGRGLNQSPENGKVGVGVGTVPQGAGCGMGGVKTRYQTGLYQ